MFSHFSYGAQHSARIRFLIHLISKYPFPYQNFSWLLAHTHVPGHFNKNKELSDRDGYITGLVHGSFPQVHQQILSVLTQRPHLHCCRANHILEFNLCLFTPTLCLNTHTRKHAHTQCDNTFYKTNKNNNIKNKAIKP